MKKIIMSGAIFALAMSWGVVGSPNLHSGKTFLTEKEMKAITASYPSDLLKKEEKKTPEQLFKEIGDGIEELKTKGATKEEVAVFEKQLKALQDAQTTSISQLKADFQGQYNELSTKLIGSGRLVQLGIKDGSMLKKMLLEKKDGIGAWKNGAAAAVTLKISTKDFLPSERFKAAGNMTESNNLLGVDPIPPLRLDGIHFDPTRPNHIREIINTVETESPVISYAQETAYNDGSAVTAQGSAATQGDFTVTQKEVTCQKINAFLTLAKEMMEDTNWIDNYINTRVVGKLLMLEDTALLTGNVTPSITGINTVAAAYDNRSLKIGKVAGDNASQSINYFDILMGGTTMLIDGTNGYYTPSEIVMHPMDYATMALSRDTYGRMQFPQVAMGEDIAVNGAKIVRNSTITKGNFLVGDFGMGATLAFRDAINITFSNQNVDNFVKGFITVLVEERLGLVVHNPNAFVYGNFASGEASGSI